jgi:outer membrane protein
VKRLVSALPCLMLAAGFMAAQTPVPTKVGVIQIQSALVSTKDGQAAASALEKKLGPKQSELQKQQQNIKELQDKLQRGATTMSQSARDDLQQKIDDQTKTFNRGVEDFQTESQNEQRKVIDALGKKMMPLIDKYAQQNGFAVILDVSNQNTPVLYASNTVDITQAIIALYDKTYPGTQAAAGAATKPAPKAAAPAKPAAAPAKPAAAPAKKP